MLRVVAIDGLIGAGKSTLLAKIKTRVQKSDKIVFVEEPVSKFKKFENYNPLELMYSDPFKYSGFTQLHILRTLASHFEEKLRENPNASILLCERTLYSPIIFTQTLSKMGYISPFERDILNNLARENLAKILPGRAKGADYVFYLSTTPEVCLTQIRNRARKEEDKVDEDYIKVLDEMYKTYLKDIKVDRLRYITCYDGENLILEEIHRILEL